MITLSGSALIAAASALLPAAGGEEEDPPTPAAPAAFLRRGGWAAGAPPAEAAAEEDELLELLLLDDEEDEEELAPRAAPPMPIPSPPPAIPIDSKFYFCLERLRRSRSPVAPPPKPPPATCPPMPSPPKPNALVPDPPNAPAPAAPKPNAPRPCCSHDDWRLAAIHRWTSSSSIHSILRIAMRSSAFSHSRLLKSSWRASSSSSRHCCACRLSSLAMAAMSYSTCSFCQLLYSRRLACRTEFSSCLCNSVKVSREARSAVAHMSRIWSSPSDVDDEAEPPAPPTPKPNALFIAIARSSVTPGVTSFSGKYMQREFGFSRCASASRGRRLL